MKRIIMVFLILSIGIVGIISIYNIKKDNKVILVKDTSETIAKETENIKEEEVIQNESNIETTTTIKQSSNQTTTSSTNNNSTINKRDKKSNTSSSINVVTTTPKAVVTTQKTPESTTKKVENNEIKKDNPWDKLGMTEYQYYNEPMYSYEKVDFSISKYGSEKEARNACINHGEKYIPYLNGEVAYHCTSVSTASGKYLGEWFHTENLE